MRLGVRKASFACSSLYISEAVCQVGWRSSLSTDIGDAFLNQHREQSPTPHSLAHVGVVWSGSGVPGGHGIRSSIRKGGCQCDAQRGRHAGHIVCFLMWLGCVGWANQWWGGARKPHVCWSFNKLTHVAQGEQRWNTVERKTTCLGNFANQLILNYWYDLFHTNGKCLSKSKSTRTEVTKSPIHSERR